VDVDNSSPRTSSRNSKAAGEHLVNEICPLDDNEGSIRCRQPPLKWASAIPATSPWTGQSPTGQIWASERRIGCAAP